MILAKKYITFFKPVRGNLISHSSWETIILQHRYVQVTSSVYRGCIPFEIYAWRMYNATLYIDFRYTQGNFGLPDEPTLPKIDVDQVCVMNASVFNI